MPIDTELAAQHKQALVTAVVREDWSTERGTRIMRMPKSKLALLGTMLISVIPTALRAQSAMDVSKVTCGQFLSSSALDPNAINVNDTRFLVIWLSGYHQGKQQSPVVKRQDLRDNSVKVLEFCRANNARTVMQAIETVLGIK